jgi:hypothetical protein
MSFTDRTDDAHCVGCVDAVEETLKDGSILDASVIGPPPLREALHRYREKNPSRGAGVAA